MSAPATRSDAYSLDRGRQFVVSYPADVTPDEASDFSEWLKLVVRKVARQAVPPTVAVVSGSAPIVSPKEPTCSRCPAFLSDADSLRLGVCAGCRAPGPTQVISSPPSHEVGGTLPAPRAKAEVPAKGKEEPAGERWPDADSIPPSRQKLRDILSQAASPMSCSDLAKAARLSYQTAYANLNNCPEFHKSLSGRWGLAKPATSTTSESEAASDGPGVGAPGTEPSSTTPTAPDGE